MRVIRMIKRVTKAETAARSAGYRVSHPDRRTVVSLQCIVCDYSHARVWAEALASDVMEFCTSAFLQFRTSFPSEIFLA